MTARAIFESAPLGSLVRYSDDQPRPPARFTRRLETWRQRNGQGILVKKAPSRTLGKVPIPETFTLQVGSYGSQGIVVLVCCASTIWRVRSPYFVERVPRPGQALVVTGFADQPELRHLAANLSEAEAWAARKGYRDAWYLQVAEDGVHIPIASAHTASGGLGHAAA
jgi:hypothetical protein